MKCKNCNSNKLKAVGSRNRTRTVITFKCIETVGTNEYKCGDCGRYNTQENLVSPNGSKYGWDVIEYIIKMRKAGKTFVSIHEELKDLNIDMAIGSVSRIFHEYNRGLK